MRKIYVIFIAVFCLIIYLAHSFAAEKINLKLDDQIGIVFLNRNMLLVVGEEDMTLLVVGKGEPNNLDKFYIRNLNLIMLDENLTHVRAEKEIILKDDCKVGDVTYSIINGLVYIHYKDTNMCIYTGGEYNISSCQFVYFYNSKISHPTIYDRNEAVFYYYKNPIPTSAMEDMYENLVETHAIRDEALTIIRLNEDDYEIVVIDND